MHQTCGPERGRSNSSLTSKPMLAVQRHVALGAGLEVGGRALGVAAVQDRAGQVRPVAAALGRRGPRPAAPGTSAVARGGGSRPWRSWPRPSRSRAPPGAACAGVSRSCRPTGSRQSPGGSHNAAPAPSVVVWPIPRGSHTRRISSANERSSLPGRSAGVPEAPSSCPGRPGTPRPAAAPAPGTSAGVTSRRSEPSGRGRLTRRARPGSRRAPGTCRSSRRSAPPGTRRGRWRR